MAADNPMPLLGWPLGDPVAMRGYATQLRHQAAIVRAGGHALVGTSEAMDFRAPVADRLRGDFAKQSQVLLNASERLETLASKLLSDASSLQEKQDFVRSMPMGVPQGANQ